MLRKNIFIFLIGLTLISCDKDNTHSGLLGTWKCDEYPEISLPRSYQVNIMRNTSFPDDSSQFVIYNFNNLGFDEEQAVFITQESETKVNITGTNFINLSITGSGTIASDFSSIEWEYVVNQDGREEFRATYY